VTLKIKILVVIKTTNMKGKYDGEVYWIRRGVDPRETRVFIKTERHISKKSLALYSSPWRG